MPRLKMTSDQFKYAHKYKYPSEILEMISHVVGERIFSIQPDINGLEYLGFNIAFKKMNLKLRRARITPKKAGQFVALWKRNAQGGTEPFHLTDPYAFYIIFIISGDKEGAFIFPRKALSDQKIISFQDQGGKRGFRLYCNWDHNLNFQALKTKIWQSNYFIDFENKEKALQKLELILGGQND